MVRIYKTIDGAIHQIQEPEEGCWIALTNPTATEIFEFSEKFDMRLTIYDPLWMRKNGHVSKLRIIIH